MHISSTISQMERLDMCIDLSTVKATKSRLFTVDTDDTVPAYQKVYLSINDSEVSSGTITSIDIPTNTILSRKDGKDIAASTSLRSGVFTVVNTTGRVLATLPLSDLDRSIHNSKKLLCDFQNVDLSKSYLTFSSGLDQSNRLIFIFNLK